MKPDIMICFKTLEEKNKAGDTLETEINWCMQFWELWDRIKFHICQQVFPIEVGHRSGVKNCMYMEIRLYLLHHPS